MGVRLLAYTASTAASDTLHARLDALGAKRAGRWRTHCVYYQPRVEGMQEQFTVTFGEHPASNVILIGGGAGGGVGGGMVLEAGAEIVGVVDAMRTHAPRLKVTAEGGLHELGDFVVRAGRLFVNETLSGTLVDVEYAPCEAPAAAAGVLAEFLSVVLPPPERSWCATEACYAGAPKLPRAFGWEHAACQFVALVRTRLGETATAASQGAAAAVAEPRGTKRNAAALHSSS